MCWVWRKYALWMLSSIVIWGSYSVESCIEEERLALLNLNSYFRSHGHPSPGDHGLGEGEEDEHDCCTWQRVRCNSTTRRVTELNLSYMVDQYDSSDQKPAWVLNVTIFQPFRELISLDLTDNNIGGLVDVSDSAKLSTLKHLQSFVLDDNYLYMGQISVSALTSLRELSLGDCRLDESTFQLKDLENLSELQVLNLNFNNFNASILHRLRYLTELQVLDLSYNKFHGSIEGLRYLTELRVLDLSYNNFHGSIEGLCELKNIMELHLSENSFHGALPSCLHNLSSLNVIDLSVNNFGGELSLSFFANFSKLRVLDLSRNQLQVYTEDSSWQPSVQLQALGLEDCSLNKFLGTIPKFLTQQYNLSELNLSGNKLVGSFPAWLLHNNSQLKALDLDNNSFTGSLELPSYARWPLKALSIAANNFQGKLPESIGLAFPQLEYLNVSGNQFEGSVPNSVARMSELQTLDLSRNNFSGELPAELLSNCTSLKNLQLQDNKLEGDIVPEYMNLPSLWWLDLSNNRFGGTIRDGLLKSSPLYYLDMSNNKITGQLPSFIGNFSDLISLSFSKNYLRGQIPTDVCRLRLNYLYLEDNNFIGPVPPCSNFSGLEYLHLSRNSLTGPIPKVFSTYSSLITLDLSYNKISGKIPQWIDRLVSLQVLVLAGNSLHGQIPHELCRLRRIDILNLSHNELSGDILVCLANMSFGMKSITPDSVGAIIIGWISDYEIASEFYSKPDEVEIPTKNVYLPYEGRNLVIMSELDLSGNNLNGIIPSELGSLMYLQSLNLSHNNLSGSIPDTFSTMKQIESLDLSHNILSGGIPDQLVKLNSLEIFNVSFNKLTGRTPETGQFGSFDESSYLGNPGLCVSNVNKSCNPIPPYTSAPSSTNTTEEYADGGGLDMADFLWSFSMTSFVAFLATVVVLHVNPEWGEAWFAFVKRHFLWWLF